MSALGWMLIGLLVIGGTLSGDADEHQASEGPHAARFERLLKQRPNDPALHYNLGTVRYRHGRYDKAAESLKRAIASSNSSLQGRASYNLGNAHYRLGRAAEQAAPNHAVDFYHNALEDYRFAIRQDPKDMDAKYNYELVERRLNALKTQQAQTSSAQQTQGEQAEQEQQQTGESKSEPGSSSSMEAAQGAERQQGQQAQAAPPQPGQEGSEQRAQTAPEAATETQDMSQQQAIWILDTLKHEERGALAQERQGPAQESDVEQDW